MSTNCENVEFGYKIPFRLWFAHSITIALFLFLIASDVYYSLSILFDKDLHLSQTQFTQLATSLMEILISPSIMLLASVFWLVQDVLLVRRGSVSIGESELAVMNWRGIRSAIPLNSISQIKLNTWDIFPTLRPLPTISIISQRTKDVHIRMLADRVGFVDRLRSRTGLTRTVTNWHHTYYLKPLD